MLKDRVSFIAARFEGLALRERVLISIALLVVTVAAFQVALFRPLDTQRKSLSAQITGITAAMDDAVKASEQASTSDPTVSALAEERTLHMRLAEVDAQLASQYAGLIPPRRMAQVIQDVLSRKHAVKLVTLRNLAPIALGGSRGPYVHVMEVVLDGPYLDVLAYLEALEKLPWRFYWRRLELDTTAYPTNRVRLELATVSMDSEWVGL